MANWILTYKGHAFDFDNIERNTIDFDDIAHALSLTCRYGGMVKHFYSVAQHSCLMADALFSYSGDTALALDGLMHDAEEYVMGDMKTPLKNLMPEFRAMSAKVDARIRSDFAWAGVPKEMQGITKTFDTRILLDEKAALLPANGPKWGFEDTYQPLGINIEPWSPPFAEQRFRDLFKFYSSLHGARQ